MSSGLGKSFQRSQRASERQSRRRYHDLLEAERTAAIEAETAQQRSGVRHNPLQSIWQTSHLEDFLSIADSREQGYFAERDVRVVIDGRPHVVTREQQLLARCDEDDEDDSRSPLFHAPVSTPLPGNHHESAQDTKPSHTGTITNTQREEGTHTESAPPVSHRLTTAHDRWMRMSESLTIPRRPVWDYSMSPQALQAAEAAGFVHWRRTLSQVEQTHGVLLTPYEKNLEVWRQLWRVVERADVVLCIVDARDPLLFRSADFERYVAATRDANGLPKQLILLLNKADLLTEDQRMAWATYLHARGDRFFFFSAKPSMNEKGAAAAAKSSSHNVENVKRSSNSEDDDDDDDDEHAPNGVGKHAHHADPHLLGEDVGSPSETADTEAGEEEESTRRKTRHRTRTLRAPVEVKNAYALRQRQNGKHNNTNTTNTNATAVLSATERARDVRTATLRQRLTKDTTLPHESSSSARVKEEFHSTQDRILSDRRPDSAAEASPSPQYADSLWETICTDVLTPLELLDRLALLHHAARRLSTTHTANSQRSRGALTNTKSTKLTTITPVPTTTVKATTSSIEPLMVGLVGYPNVGKSSTINALLGAKKVTVSATPGKTKHFQTLCIPGERRVMLCDCPGLVFPSFVTTQARMVCSGMLSIDTATDMTRAIALMCRRLPRALLEQRLRISLGDARACNTQADGLAKQLGASGNAELDADGSTYDSHTAHRRDPSSLLPYAHDGDSHSPAEQLLNALARRRGYMTAHDRPHQSRAAKELLKMYVDGELVYVEPPPSYTHAHAHVTHAHGSDVATEMAKAVHDSAQVKRVPSNVPRTLLHTGTNCVRACDGAKSVTRALRAPAPVHVELDAVVEGAGESDEKGAHTESKPNADAECDAEAETDPDKDEDWDTEEDEEEHEEDWDTEEEEAWADLDRADAARGLSDAEDEHDDDNTNTNTNKHSTHRICGRRARRRRHMRRGAHHDDDDDSDGMDGTHVHRRRLQFFLRPAHAGAQLTRQESFNAVGNAERLRELGEAAAAQRRRLRRRHGQHHYLDDFVVVSAWPALAANENTTAGRAKGVTHADVPVCGVGSRVDPYTFINEDGEVELRIDDDDGVVELTMPPVSQAERSRAEGAAAMAGGRMLAAGRFMSKRQQRRETKRMGGRVVGIQGYS